MTSLATERMILRRIDAGDLDELVALHNDPVVMRFINGGAPVPRADIAAQLPQWSSDPIGVGRLAAIARTGEFLGWFGLRTPPAGEVVGAEAGDADLGYRLRRAVWGRGLATEGSRALLRYAFADLGAARVIATTMTVNGASRRVLEKVGLRYLSTFHLDWPETIEGAEAGDVLYGLTKPEWLGS